MSSTHRFLRSYQAGPTSSGPVRCIALRVRLGGQVTRHARHGSISILLSSLKACYRGISAIRNFPPLQVFLVATQQGQHRPGWLAMHMFGFVHVVRSRGRINRAPSVGVIPPVGTPIYKNQRHSLTGRSTGPNSHLPLSFSMHPSFSSPTIIRLAVGPVSLGR